MLAQIFDYEQRIILLEKTLGFVAVSSAPSSPSYNPVSLTSSTNAPCSSSASLGSFTPDGASISFCPCSCLMERKQKLEEKIAELERVQRERIKLYSDSCDALRQLACELAVDPFSPLFSNGDEISLESNIQEILFRTEQIKDEIKKLQEEKSRRQKRVIQQCSVVAKLFDDLGESNATSYLIPSNLSELEADFLFINTQNPNHSTFQSSSPQSTTIPMSSEAAEMTTPSLSALSPPPPPPPSSAPTEAAVFHNPEARQSLNSGRLLDEFVWDVYKKTIEQSCQSTSVCSDYSSELLSSLSVLLKINNMRLSESLIKALDLRKVSCENEKQRRIATLCVLRERIFGLWSVLSIPHEERVAASILSQYSGYSSDDINLVVLPNFHQHFSNKKPITLAALSSVSFFFLRCVVLYVN